MSLLSNAFGKSRKVEKEFTIRGQKSVLGWTEKKWKQAGTSPIPIADYQLSGGMGSSIPHRLIGFVHQYEMSDQLKEYYSKVKEFALSFDYSQKRSGLLTASLSHDEIFPQHALCYFYLSDFDGVITDICYRSDVADHKLVKEQLEKCNEYGLIEVLAREFEKYVKKELNISVVRDFRDARVKLYGGKVWNL